MDIKNPEERRQAQEEALAKAPESERQAMRDMFARLEAMFEDEGGCGCSGIPPEWLKQA